MTANRSSLFDGCIICAVKSVLPSAGDGAETSTLLSDPSEQTKSLLFSCNTKTKQALFLPLVDFAFIFLYLLFSVHNSSAEKQYELKEKHHVES